MKKDLAKLVALTAFRSTAEMGNLVPMLKEYCPPEEYQIFAKAIARFMAEANVQVINKVFAIYPDPKNEFEEKIKEYGRAFVPGDNVHND